mgnify:CR=1 FL=1
MKAKKLFLLLLGLSLPFAMAGRENATTIQLSAVKEQTAKVYENVVAKSASDNEDPSAVFASALSGYESQFSDWLDVTALNVTVKEAIELADYDPNYVSPEFSDVLYDYQLKLVRTLPTADQQNLDSLRRRNYFFDRYMTLNEGRYADLTPSLKYPHAEIPLDPRTPITPMHPDFTSINSINSSTQITAVAVSGIVAILTGAGLKEAAIAAFTACVSAMTTGLSTSWIPIVGWALAVALVVGALIAITVIIVKNWLAIRSSMDEIKTWFLGEFTKFASFIESFFADAVAKGNESLVSSRAKIGDKTFEFQEVLSKNATTQFEMAEKMRDNEDVLLMWFVKPLSFQVAFATPVDEEFCVTYKTHCLGFSSYTWTENTARSLILRAGSGYTSATPELHLWDLFSIGGNIVDKPNKKDPAPEYAFQHFHNFTADGKRADEKLLHRVHSFFGPLYYTPNKNGKGVLYQP